MEIARTIGGTPAITLKIYVETGETSRTRPVDCLAKSPAPPTSVTTILPGWTGGLASIATSPSFFLNYVNRQLVDVSAPGYRLAPRCTRGVVHCCALSQG